MQILHDLRNSLRKAELQAENGMTTKDLELRVSDCIGQIQTSFC